MHRNWPQIGTQPHLPDLTQQLFGGGAGSALEGESGGCPWGHTDLHSVIHQSSLTSDSHSSSPSRLWGDLKLVTNHSFDKHCQTINTSSSPTLDPPELSGVPQGVCHLGHLGGGWRL